MRVRAEAGLPIKKKTSILCAFSIEDTNVAIGLGKFNKKIEQTISQSLKEIKGKNEYDATRRGKQIDEFVLQLMLFYVLFFLFDH